MTMAMTGKTAPYKRDFGVMPGGVFHARYPVASKGISVDAAIESVENIFSEDVSAHDVAAIVLEPVQGEGGFNVVPAEFLKRLRAICDQHGILLIADEVQTGFARTGKLFAMDHYETKADLITMAKSLGGGFPISGVVGRIDVMDAPNPGGLGGTYAGNPIAVAAAHAVIDAIEEEKLCDRANVLGAELVAVLKQIQSETTIVNDVLLTCGKNGNVIRFLYPLTIPTEQFRQALDILKQGFDSLALPATVGAQTAEQSA